MHVRQINLINDVQNEEFFLLFLQIGASMAKVKILN